MLKPFAALTFVAALFAGCVNVALPPNRSLADPSDPSAPEASARRFRPNLVATTNVYLDPSVGQGAQKMDHSKMQGMDNMSGMDHSKMPGMEPKQPPATAPSPQSQEMDHSKMPGMEPKQPPAPAPSPQSQDMTGMDHSKMPGMNPQQPASAPPRKEALDKEMKKTSDEMKKLSDELKAKSDAAKSAKKSPTPEEKK